MTPDVPESRRARSLGEVFELFDEWGSCHYDEVVTQLDHALQTAAIARREGASDALIAAALLHDVGHLLELRDGGAAGGATVRDLGHEQRGQRWLGELFALTVRTPIALHVAAKRYRCANETSYVDGLSDGSRRSLSLQGGPMSAREATEFLQLPGSEDAIRLRGWDDAGKVDGLDVFDINSYQPLLQRLLVSTNPA